jgi:predicted phosphate transport protein (TIGR00153 family)
VKSCIAERQNQKTLTLVKKMIEVEKLEKRSYAWFEKRRKTKALELAQEQMVKALDTVALLHQATQSIAQKRKEEATQRIQHIFRTEEEVDRLRKEIFKELSKGAALLADYREDLLHLVKRLDTLADHVKDAARCLEMLLDTQLPQELIEGTIHMTSNLVDCASALRNSIEKMSTIPEAIESLKKVDETEHQIDDDYLKIKKLFVKHGEQTTAGVLVIFDDLIEFIEHAADMCADTADYILILASEG